MERHQIIKKYSQIIKQVKMKVKPAIVMNFNTVKEETVKKFFEKFSDKYYDCRDSFKDVHSKIEIIICMNDCFGNKHFLINLSNQTKSLLVLNEDETREKIEYQNRFNEMPENQKTKYLIKKIKK